MPNRAKLRPQMKRSALRLCLLILMIAGAGGAGIVGLTVGKASLGTPASVAADSSAPLRTGASGLPLPRFVSLKADRVNVRAGPGRDHRVLWTFTKAGLPVEITAEFDNWRRIRDSDGAEGWVFHSLLSGRRTGVIAPWSEADSLTLRRDAAANAAAAAYVEPGVMVDVGRCDGTWCEIAVQSVRGWIEQERLWGVYPRETIR